MRPAPLRFVYRNLIWNAAGEVRACYRLATASYDGLTDEGKVELAAALGEFAIAVERDFQLLRVTRTWSVASYLEDARRLIGAAAHPEQWDTYLAEHERALSGREAARPEVYLCVRLAGHDEPSGFGLGGFGQELRAAATRALGALGLASPLALTERRLSALLREERLIFDEMEMLGAEPASVREIEWLVRRCFTRGIGEPEVEDLFSPQAVVVEDDGGVRWEPLEVDLLRWVDCEIDRSDPACLRIVGERGETHQALLAVGALPSAIAFPSHRAELLFYPLENAGFPVDACVSVRHLSNERARDLVRKRSITAGHVRDAEEESGFGVSLEADLRPRLAQALLDYLDSDAYPPLFTGAITLAVGAPTRDDLDARIAALRRGFKPVQLHQPRGRSQLDMFCGALPGQPPAAAGYSDVFYPEQLGSFVPTATYHAGSEGGVYIARTLSASAQPVRFDCREASRRGLPGAIVFVGTLGGGKTVSAQGAFVYPEVLGGSQAILVDPRGDNKLPDVLRSQGLGHAVQEVELPGGEQRRGLLDPLRIAPHGMEADLAADFLLGLFREPNDARATEIQIAIHDVVRSASERGRRGTCGEVIARLREAGSPEASQAARHLAAVSASGLAALGFAEPDSDVRELDEVQVTVFRLRNLVLPPAGTSPEHFTAAQRLSRQVLHLLATYALAVMGRPGIHKVFSSDEAWMLLDDDQGRRILSQAGRWGRGQSVTLLLLTQIVRDIAGLENLIGAVFAFHMEADDDITAALRLLGRDPSDERMRSRLRHYRAGRCLMRDYDGQVAPVKIDLVSPELVARLDTTPEHLRDETPAEERREAVA